MIQEAGRSRTAQLQEHLNKENLTHQAGGSGGLWVRLPDKIQNAQLNLNYRSTKMFFFWVGNDKYVPGMYNSYLSFKKLLNCWVYLKLKLNREYCIFIGEI